MSTLLAIAQPIAPVSADLIGGAVFDRFEADGDLIAIAVVDENSAPVGLIERNSFMIKMASNYGRSLYAGRPIALIMDSNPLILDGARRHCQTKRTSSAFLSLVRW